MDAVFTTRAGGVSTGPYESLNLSFKRESNEKFGRSNVLENFKRVAAALDMTTDCMVSAQQIHSCNVGVVRSEHRGSGVVKPYVFTCHDSLITNENGVALVTLHADCVPIFLCDPVRKAVGMVHSGWKGTALKISEMAVKVMKSQFGSDPGDIVAVIGPAICGNCFEIGEDVYKEFKNDFNQFINKVSKAKWLVDLSGIVKKTLEVSGVPQENIDMTGICTFEDKTNFFSHRREKGRTGTMAGIIYIKDELCY
ncbi:MAG: peptidoglycan editing factor PgeF [Clostridiales bacterium]|jgi:YfiH family protein|nr:peptidoglycan editing factor PgeF [Clostridiales bacterium]